MKISEALSDSYLHCLLSSNGNVKTVCDALQQAVAEALQAKFRYAYLADGDTYDMETDPHHEYSEADWLAEADKLLRGQK